MIRTEPVDHLVLPLDNPLAPLDTDLARRLGRRRHHLGRRVDDGGGRLPQGVHLHCLLGLVAPEALLPRAREVIVPAVGGRGLGAGEGPEVEAVALRAGGLGGHAVCGLEGDEGEWLSRLLQTLQTRR